jgi:hypothetical protein
VGVKKRNLDLEMRVKAMDQKISGLKDARQMMNGFEGLEREYKEMVGDLVSRLSERDKTIEALTTKIVIIEKRHKDYRFLFGNVNNLQEKLVKMERVYTEKLSKCFHHYSSTMTDVSKEARLMESLVTKLRSEKIIATKASSQLAEM